MQTILAAVLSVVVPFLVLATVFRIIDIFRPRELRLPLIARSRWLDLTYWVMGPLVTDNLGKVAIMASVIPVALLAYGKLDGELISHGFGPLSRLPFWVQAPLMLLVSDLASYWVHRLFHGRLWPVHAVHHSTEKLDWMSALRVHPLNDVGMRVATTLPIIALGFAPIAVMGIASFGGILAIVVHANVDWDWGPLRAVIVSPRFHRWHHTTEAEARDKNFAGLLPLWDIVFGTYYMPREKMPRRFGTDAPVPPGFFGQMAYPFRRHRSTINT